MTMGLSEANAPAVPSSPKKTTQIKKKSVKEAPKKRKVKQSTATSRGDINRELYTVRRIRVEVTAYSAPCSKQGTGEYTRTGRRVYRIENGRKVKNPGCAVDPKLIPLGSIVEINGILYPADDTGGAIHGRHIDLRLNSYDEAVAWGKRWITVTVYERRGKDNGCKSDR